MKINLVQAHDSIVGSILALKQGTTSQAAKEPVRAVGRGFIPRQKAHRINVGFSRWGMFSALLVSN
jgi:hypothetical protein